MAEYLVTGTSEYYFTEVGKAGLWLFFGGCGVTGITALFWMGQLAQAAKPYAEQPGPGLPIMMLIGAVAATAGLFMVFIGRFLRHDFHVRPRDQS